MTIVPRSVRRPSLRSRLGLVLGCALVALTIGNRADAQTLEEAMRYRAFDVWVHEQDLRAALGRPGYLDSPGAHIVRDELLAALPRVVAKDAGAPPGSALVFDIHGPIEFLRTVRVDADGRGSIDGTPSLGPAVSLTLDWETYVRLACGRVTADIVADRIKAEGDPELTAAILLHFAVTK